MLKRRARFAQARLPAILPEEVSAAPSAAGEQADAPWPEPALAPDSKLWLCISFKTLDTENNENLSSRAVAALARRAWRYTPVVSCGDSLLLLEIAGSLRLFGGLQGLRERLHADLCPPGYAAVMACAPAPRAAEWLVRAGESRACHEATSARQALAALPLSATGWPEKVQRMLGQMGLHTLGCCLRLPRDGFARRAGKRCLQQLDEALGRRRQLLQYFVPPLRFRRRLELDAETQDHTQLQAAAESLFLKLGRFLQRRQAVIDGFVLVLGYELGAQQEPPVVLRMGTGRPCMQPEVFAELTALRLEQLQLSAPVTWLQLSARATVMPREDSMTLPGIPAAGGAQADPEQQARLLARLRARLGATRVYGIAPVAEHRPERAWQAAESPARYRKSDDKSNNKINDSKNRGNGSQRMQAWGAPRPLWLLSEPRRIAAPQTDGLSACVAERIESGWWDGHDVRRDYYRVVRPDGSCWWVYRDCREKEQDQGWYLHGLFG
ncbi:MAG: DNA polymerase Y family protein [Gammaproteobacteria bacterium]|nr:DNA polymerase Y family protein [Gammaproteobacteria bacterium]